MASRDAEIAQIIAQIDARLAELRAIEQALLDFHNSRALNGVQNPADRVEEEGR